MATRPNGSALSLGDVGWGQEGGSTARTGHVPPETMRSKERASGIPVARPVLPDLIESSTYFFSSELKVETDASPTWRGRRYVME